MITHVAIKHNDGRVFSLPKRFRHHHVIQVMAKICKLKIPITGEQGFVDINGNFLNRIDAGIYALNTNQISELKYGSELYSEDLW